MKKGNLYQLSCLRIFFRIAVLCTILQAAVWAETSYSYQNGPVSSEMKKTADGYTIRRDETPPNRVFFQSAAALTDDSFTGEKCIASGECEVCDYGIGLEGCAFTGRRKKYDCFDSYGKVFIAKEIV